MLVSLTKHPVTLQMSSANSETTYTEILKDKNAYDWGV